MKITTIDIPIYQCRLTIILDKDLSYVEDNYDTGSLEEFGAVTLRSKEDRHYVVAFTDKKHLSNIAHEIVHIKNFLYLDCAMEIDRHNDEPEAYLTGWLFDEIYNFIKK
jgi:uncharacterized protein YlbG (UPF0298 family)